MSSWKEVRNIIKYAVLISAKSLDGTKAEDMFYVTFNEIDFEDEIDNERQYACRLATEKMCNTYILDVGDIIEIKSATRVEN